MLIPGSGKKEMWAEVTARVHHRHYDIIKRLAEMVNNGSITSKGQALEARSELLEC